MSNELLAALILIFGACVAVTMVQTPRHNVSPLTYGIAGPLVTLGIIGGFLAIFLFIKDQGFWPGLGYWFVASCICFFIIKPLMDSVSFFGRPSKR
jgi:hypothetical protein